MKAKIYGEMHCDECCEIAHNHFVECPACHEKHAATGSFHDLDEDGDTEISCEECGAIFRKTSPDGWYGDEVELELISGEATA